MKEITPENLNSSGLYNYSGHNKKHNEYFTVIAGETNNEGKKTQIEAWGFNADPDMAMRDALREANKQIAQVP